MDPYGFQYRSKSHLIAIADIGLSVVQTIWSLIFLASAFGISEKPKVKEPAKSSPAAEEEEDIEGLQPSKPEKTGDVSGFYVFWFWLNAIALFCICVVEIVAAIKLLNATNPGTEPVKALKWSKFWRLACGIFIIITVFNLFFCSSGRGIFACFLILVSIGIRGAALFFVHKFIGEVVGFTACGQTLPTPGGAPGAMYQSNQYSSDMMDSKVPNYDDYGK